MQGAEMACVGGEGVGGVQGAEMGAVLGAGVGVGGTQGAGMLALGVGGPRGAEQGGVLGVGVGGTQGAEQSGVLGVGVGGMQGAEVGAAAARLQAGYISSTRGVESAGIHGSAGLQGAGVADKQGAGMTIMHSAGGASMQGSGVGGTHGLDGARMQHLLHEYVRSKTTGEGADEPGCGEDQQQQLAAGTLGSREPRLHHQVCCMGGVQAGGGQVGRWAGVGMGGAWMDEVGSWGLVWLLAERWGNGGGRCWSKGPDMGFRVYVYCPCVYCLPAHFLCTAPYVYCLCACRFV